MLVQPLGFCDCLLQQLQLIVWQGESCAVAALLTGGLNGYDGGVCLRKRLQAEEGVRFARDFGRAAVHARPLVCVDLRAAVAGLIEAAAALADERHTGMRVERQQAVVFKQDDALRGAAVRGGAGIAAVDGGISAAAHCRRLDNCL